jgi:hypothetical protein
MSSGTDGARVTLELNTRSPIHENGDEQHQRCSDESQVKQQESF